MRTLILYLIIIGCFAIGYFTKGTFGALSLLLSILSFALGAIAYSDVAHEKALNGELLEVKKKYYELKYIKDKVE